jgi:hypothetical protein
MNGPCALLGSSRLPASGRSFALLRMPGVAFKFSDRDGDLAPPGRAFSFAGDFVRARPLAHNLRSVAPIPLHSSFRDGDDIQLLGAHDSGSRLAPSSMSVSSLTTSSNVKALSTKDREFP